jgi:hypothetical protein
LTDRQVAVLAAVERLFRPTLLDLRIEFEAPSIPPDEIVRFRCTPRALQER